MNLDVGLYDIYIVLVTLAHVCLCYIRTPGYSFSPLYVVPYRPSRGGLFSAAFMGAPWGVNVHCLSRQHHLCCSCCYRWHGFA